MVDQSMRRWVAFGAMSVAVSIGLAAFGRHGIEEAEIQMRWGIAVDYLRFMGLGLMVMATLRRLFLRTTSVDWPERILVAGVGCFSGMLFLECSPWAPFVTTLEWTAPLGGIMMIFSWLLFFLQFYKYAEHTDG